MRKIIASALQKDPAIEVVGFAANGLQAIEAIKSCAPDVMTLDIEMPEMDTSTKAETNAIKAFLSRDTDRCRLSYARTTKDF